MAGLKSCTVPSVGLNEGQRTYFFLLCLSYSLFLAQRSENLHSRCTDSFDNSVCFREEHPESNWSHKMARVLISDTLLTQFLHRVQASILSACVCVCKCVCGWVPGADEQEVAVWSMEISLSMLLAAEVYSCPTLTVNTRSWNRTSDVSVIRPRHSRCPLSLAQFYCFPFYSARFILR